jgi:hypothetical protein
LPSIEPSPPEEWLAFAGVEIGATGGAVTEVQVVVQAVCVIMKTVDVVVCWLDDRAAVQGVLIAGIKVGLGTPEDVGTILLRPSSSIKEDGEMLTDFKELIEVGESEQLVSVTVVLSVTVTMGTGKGFSRVEVEVLEKEVLL